MLKEEMELLSGQAHAFTQAYKESLKDENDIEVFQGFVARFYSLSGHHLLVTRDQLTKVQSEIQNRDVLVNYVFGLRFFSLGLFTRKEISIIADGFAGANAPRQTTDTNFSVLPDDAIVWTVQTNELIPLYENNTWILPLLSLGFVFPEMISS